MSEPVIPEPSLPKCHTCGHLHACIDCKWNAAEAKVAEQAATIATMQKDWDRLNRVFKATSDKTIDQDIEIGQQATTIGELTAEVKGMTWSNRAALREVDRLHNQESEQAATIERLAKERDDARAANECDRTALHRVVHEIDSEIKGRMWLIEGRGPYEWDDDRYRQEFGWAVQALEAKIESLRKIAGDLKNCPNSQAGVDAALKGQEKP